MKPNIFSPKVILDDLLSLLYPKICLLCNAPVQIKDHLCISCDTQLPKTDTHTTKDNIVTDKFYGRVNIEFGGAFYLFGAGNRTQDLIHQIKYNGKSDLGFLIGKMYGDILKESPLFPMIDYIIPVPLHPMRFHQRGFNQSEWIAKGLAESLELKMDTKSFIRKDYTQTQTRKTRHSRFQNVKDAFEVLNADKLAGKHILLVDDVLTTGATLEACSLTLQEKIPNLKISIVTMAVGE